MDGALAHDDRARPHDDRAADGLAGVSAPLLYEGRFGRPVGARGCRDEGQPEQDESGRTAEPAQGGSLPVVWRASYRWDTSRMNVVTRGGDSRPMGSR